MADSKYTIFITGSNAKILSGEVNTTLGGRFLIAEVYPYSFHEFLTVHQVPTGEIDLLTTEGRQRLYAFSMSTCIMVGYPQQHSYLQNAAI